MADRKRIKFPGFKILDGYITRKFLGTYVFAIALIIVIVVVFDAVEKMDDFITTKASLKAVALDYYLNFIPYFINQFSGLFTFIAVIFFTDALPEPQPVGDTQRQRPASGVRTATSHQKRLYPLRTPHLPSGLPGHFRLHPQLQRNDGESLLPRHREVRRQPHGGVARSLGREIQSRHEALDSGEIPDAQLRREQRGETRKKGEARHHDKPRCAGTRQAGGHHPDHEHRAAQPVHPRCSRWNGKTVSPTRWLPSC